MWRRTACYALCSWIGLSLVATGQEPTRFSSLLVRSNLFQFEIILGRVSATNVRLGPARSQALTNQSGGRTETLTVGFHNQSPTLHYELVSAEQRLVVDLSREQILSIHRTPIAPSLDDPEQPLAELAFQQDPRGKLRFIVKHAEATHEYHAPSIWHLMFTEPLAFHAHLVPLLEQLRPGWDLNDLGRHVRQSLLRFSEHHPLPDTQQIRRLVDDLGSTEFQKRQAADRELRRIGPVTIPFLLQIDPLRLDNEQRARVRSIVASMRSATTGDTTERVASWLAADRNIWLTMLADHELSVRVAATNHLEKLVGQPFAFSPTGSENERQQQLALLRKRWPTE